MTLLEKLSWKTKIGWQKLRLAFWTLAKAVIKTKAAVWIVRQAIRFWRWFTFAPKPLKRRLFKDERGILYERYGNGPTRRLGPESTIHRADGSIKRVVYVENRPADKKESRKRARGLAYRTKDGRVIPARTPASKAEVENG